MERDTQSFAGVRSRLEQIVDEVSADDISLDDALKLYEEAVKLGLSACELSESDLLPEEVRPEAESEDSGDMQVSIAAPVQGALAEESDVAEAALIEQVGDAASMQTA